MRCDQCRHWKESEDDWRAVKTGFKLCTAIKEQWVVAERATDHLTYPCRPEGGPLMSPERERAIEDYLALQDQAIIQAQAYVIDASQYRAQLWTGPDFFCARFSG